MQRVIEEQLVGKKNVDPITFAIQYIADNAKDIIIHDLQEILYRGEVFQRPTLLMLEEIITKFLDQRKEKFGQKGIAPNSDTKALD